MAAANSQGSLSPPQWGTPGAAAAAPHTGLDVGRRAPGMGWGQQTQTGDTEKVRPLGSPEATAMRGAPGKVGRLTSSSPRPLRFQGCWTREGQSVLYLIYYSKACSEPLSLFLTRAKQGSSRIGKTDIPPRFKSGKNFISS